MCSSLLSVGSVQWQIEMAFDLIKSPGIAVPQFPSTGLCACVRVCVRVCVSACERARARVCYVIHDMVLPFEFWCYCFVGLGRLAEPEIRGSVGGIVSYTEVASAFHCNGLWFLQRTT